MAKKRLVVIDGKSVFYRGYYAMPNLATKDGTPTGGVYGFAVMALEVLKKMQPDYVCVAWDKPKTNIRRRQKIFKDYKANRKPAPPDFYEQVPLLHELLEAFGWPLYEIDDHEADDIMGTFAAQADKKGYETLLVTSDHDVLQLINDSTKVAALKRGLTHVQMFDAALFKDFYGMTPEQFVDYKSLRGDASDNIPGVAGIGDKTAKELISKYESLDGVYKHLKDIRPNVRKKLEAGKKDAYLTRDLVILDTKVPLKLEWSKADIHRVDPLEIIEKLREFEFRTLIKQLPPSMQVDQAEQNSVTTGTLPKLESTIVRDDEQLRKIDQSSPKTCVIQTWSKAQHGQNVRFIALSPHSGTGWLFDADAISKTAFQKWLGSYLKETKLIGHDVKSSQKALMSLDVPIPPVEHDTRMGAFLINSLIREQALTSLARDELGYEGEDLDEVPFEDVTTIAPKVIAAIWGVYEAQMHQLEKLPKIAKLAREIEWPIIPILAKMERAGIKLDAKYLKKMSKELADDISDIEQSIYGHANQEFNIASPQQLAEVLFHGLKLPTQSIKKTKTSYSTAATELDKLRSQHPIIDLITQYRELTKLKSTYVDVLPDMVDEHSRLHTTFSIDVAPTGRLSSHDPNLQNIPVRSEIGRKIRSAFVAESGKTLVSADYSQFELRLAAVLAGDDELIEVFNDGVDIHTRTASQVYGVALEDVNKNQRRSAKVINFGIMYGMSPHGLSVATGMTQKDAQEFIKRYFDLRKPLLDFIERTKEQARDQGYVETMFGRRRPTPDVKSSNYVVRSAAERAAVNMPIQGTESDLMKMAMIEVDKKLAKEAVMLLQIHDSVLVECPKAMAVKVGKTLKKTMENVYELPVKLDVDITTGKHWGEL